MDEVKNKNTKAANQAWRRKPRRWAPKSRLGCKTCKIRRIKCDLSQPSCLKCKSTGRTCDSYGEMPLISKTEIEPSHYHNEKASRADSCQPCATTTSAYQLAQWQHAKDHGPFSQILGALMILPVVGPAQKEAIRFFEYISIKHLDKYNPCESWRKTLMFFAQTVPSVQHAAIALALIHRNYLDRDSSDRSVHQPQSPFNDSLPDKEVPLLHYNRAIQLLLDQGTGNSTKTTTITLLVCYLFICFDQLAGNYAQAMKHLRGGVELSRTIDKAILNNNNGDAQQSGVGTLICQVTKQIRRLDMQAASFLVDWDPTNIDEKTLVSQIPSLAPKRYSFQSLDQAADDLQILIARVIRLHNTQWQPLSSAVNMLPPSPSPSPSPKDIILRQLETWSGLFENMLQQVTSYETDCEMDPLISLLRLQYTISWTLLCSYGGSGREMDYDNFMPQFQQCLALASDVAAVHERYSGSLKPPTFTPEIGIVPVLYIIGVKCRHPVVRREVLHLLRRHPVREAVWDSFSIAKVVERVIEIEEGGGSGEEGEMRPSLEQIPVWQRVEALSWIQVVSEGRLDIQYTFCMREGVHAESLMI